MDAGSAADEDVVSPTASRSSSVGRVRGAPRAVEEQDEGLDSSQKIAHAREYLAEVAQELAYIQEHLGGASDASPEQAAHVEEPVASNAVEDWDKGDPGLDPGALRRRVRHLEVDCQGAKAKASRLEAEREALIAAQERLEAGLRAAREALAETRRQLKHKEIEVAQLSAGKPALAFYPEGKSSGRSVNETALATQREEDLLAAPALNVMAQTVSGARRSPTHTRQQLAEALRATQAQLLQEQKHSAKLERRVQKDRERMERLVALAEQQRDEIGDLRRRTGFAEGFAAECEDRLRRTNGLDRAPVSPGSPVAQPAGAQGPNAGGARSPQANGAMSVAGCGAQGPKSPMTRQQSAPGFLPTVAPRRA